MNARQQLPKCQGERAALEVGGQRGARARGRGAVAAAAPPPADQSETQCLHLGLKFRELLGPQQIMI